MGNFLANHTDVSSRLSDLFCSVNRPQVGPAVPHTSELRRSMHHCPRLQARTWNKHVAIFFKEPATTVIAVLRFFTTKSYRWRNLSCFQDSAQEVPEHSCKMQMDSSSGRASRCNKLAWWKFRDVVLECDVRRLEKSGSNSWKHSLWIEILQSTLPLRNKGSVRGSILLSWDFHRHGDFQTRPSTDGLRFKN